MTCQSADGEILGYPMRVPGDGIQYLHNQRIGRVEISDATRLDPTFAYYLFKSDWLNRELFISASGSKILHTAPERIHSVQFAFPVLAEQRRIAGVLSALDELIEANRSAMDGLAKLASTLPTTVDAAVPLSELADMAPARQVRPSGSVEHFSLPAYDEGALADLVDGSEIKSGKLSLIGPTVLVSRLNPKWERCWMAYPGSNAVASTEFVPLIGHGVATEEVWSVTSPQPFWEQMRERVTGTTGSHQRVGKASMLTLAVPDVRLLPPATRKQIVACVRAAEACRDEIADLVRTRDELLPLLMSGKVRVSEPEAA